MYLFASSFILLVWGERRRNRRRGAPEIHRNGPMNRISLNQKQSSNKIRTRGAGEGEAGDPAVESARGRGEIDRAPRALMGEGPRDRDPDPEPEAGTNTMLPNPMNIPK